MPVTALSRSSDATRLRVARAERRLADAFEEFDAALAAGRPMPTLTARDHEVQLAAVALAAVCGVTRFPAAAPVAAG